MTACPSLALCVPAFNATPFLPRLFEAVRTQTIPFDEVLLYDDASTDGTGDMARSFGATVVRGDVNRGCSFGKNELAKRAGTDWLHFCDADDVRMPPFAELARGWMDIPSGPDVVMMSYEDRDPSGGLLLTRLFDDESLGRDALRTVLLSQHSNCGIYRKDAFLRAGGFDSDPAVLLNEDDALHVRLALEGLRFRAEKRVSAAIFQQPGSMSRIRQLPCLRAKYFVMAKAAARAPETHYDAIALVLWRCAGSLVGLGDWEYAQKCTDLAARLGVPSAPEGKAYFRLLSRVSPTLALRIRERAIRLFKPHLRKRAAHPVT